MIVAGSAVRGAIRGVATETGTLLSELISIAASLMSLWLAWKAGRQLSSWVTSVNASTFPLWLQNLIQTWKSSPVVAQLIAFFIIYLCATTIIRRIARALPWMVANHLQVPTIPSRWLGGGLGVIAGSIRMVLLGALVFGALQYLSLPALAQMTDQSSVYQYLQKYLYKPYLTSVLVKDLPVFAGNAFQPITKNINLFVVPTSVNGDGRGILVVPKEVSSVAKEITKGLSNPNEKAYALYDWEARHIHYDWKKYNDFVYKNQWDGQSPLDTLESHKGVCADYALLYADMAHSVGLVVKIDQGMAGEFGDTGPHAWNEFYDPQQGRWIPLDTTWGSEMNAWFNPPGFNSTHHLQRSILIPGGSV